MTDGTALVVETIAKSALAGRDFWTVDKPSLHGPYIMPAINSNAFEARWIGWWVWIIAGRIVAEPFEVSRIRVVTQPNASDIASSIQRALDRLEARVRGAMIGIGGILDGESLPIPEAIASPEAAPTEG